MRKFVFLRVIFEVVLGCFYGYMFIDIFIYRNSGIYISILNVFICVIEVKNYLFFC